MPQVGLGPTIIDRKEERSVFSFRGLPHPFPVSTHHYFLIVLCVVSEFFVVG